MNHEEVLQMSFFSKLNNTFANLVRKYKRATPKQLVMGGVFALAFAGAIAGGFASQSTSLAYSCSDNNVMWCGTVDRYNFVSQIQNGDNHNNDLKTVYAHFGLTSDKYADFSNYAQQGVMDRNGNITVNGETVATEGLSLGRHNYSYTSTPATAVSIGGKTFYQGTPNQRWTSGTSKMDVMVWFNENGVVQGAFMNSCGNPVPGFKSKTPTAECTALQPHAVSGKKNTYTFTTDVVTPKLASYVKFTYYVNGKEVDSTSSASEKTKAIELKEDSTVEVKVTVKYLDGRIAVLKTICKREIKFEKEEVFNYVCKALIAQTTDNITFRFSVKASHSSNVKLISADFTLDSKTVTPNVKDKNDEGEFYKDYTFNDEKTHTVTAVVNVEYTKDGKLVKDQTKVSKDCTEKVTPKQKPVCKYNPKLEPNDPKCKPPVEECKPGVPKGDARCEEPKCDQQDGKGEGCELPSTGPAGMAGLFAGVSAFGAAAHRFVMNRRRQ